MSAIFRPAWLLLWLGTCALPLLHVAPAAAQDDISEGGGGDGSEASSDDEAAADEQSPENNGEGDSAQAHEPDATTSLGDVRFSAFAGAGAGTRSFRRPVKGMGVQRLDDVLFPALDAGLRVTAWPAQAFSLEFLLRYQTSIGMRVEQQPLFALGNYVSVRASRVELSVAPQFRLGDTPSSVAFLLPVGFALRTFWPEVHALPVPGYTLGGPQARAELAIPFLDIVTLRFGPEVQWIVMIDQSLQNDGLANQGVAFGGEALLQFQVSTLLGIELTYRESHALVLTSVTDETFFDVERFFTGRVSATW